MTAVLLSLITIVHNDLHVSWNGLTIAIVQGFDDEK
jgi:hypothetical protein